MRRTCLCSPVEHARIVAWYRFPMRYGHQSDVDFVCIDCLTESESDQVDAYFAKTEPIQYSKAHAEALIQAASKMLQERISK